MAVTTTTAPQPLPMFGAWNEHWKNHPAGLPISQYKPNTNPNTGAASVDAAYNAWKATQTPTTQPPAPNPTPSPTPAPATTPTATPWNGWYQDFRGASPTTTPMPTTGGTPSGAGNSAQTPLSQQYTPAMMQQLYDNPWFAVGDVFKGISPTSPLYQQLRDIGGDPLALFNMLKGSQPGGAANTGPAAFTDWLGAMYGQQGKVGGQGFDAKQLINTLFGQQKFGSESDNVIGQLLGAGDMSAQTRTLYNLARDATNVGMNPLASKAYQASLAQALDKYGTSMIGADATQAVNPTTWLKSHAPWLTLG